MKKYILMILWLILLANSMYLTYKYGYNFTKILTPEVLKPVLKVMIYMFVGGFALAGFIFEVMYFKTSDSIVEYKRELEKKSIDKDENSSKIKVLESKIEVLEKALQDALNK